MSQTVPSCTKCGALYSIPAHFAINQGLCPTCCPMRLCPKCDWQRRCLSSWQAPVRSMGDLPTLQRNKARARRDRVRALAEGARRRPIRESPPIDRRHLRLDDLSIAIPTLDSEPRQRPAG